MKRFFQVFNVDKSYFLYRLEADKPMKAMAAEGSGLSKRNKE
jgi:hypothetical protein